MMGRMTLVKGRMLLQKEAREHINSSCICSSNPNLTLSQGTQFDEDTRTDARIDFWDIRAAGGNKVASFEECHSDDVTQIKFHPSQAEAMMSGSTDSLVCLYNLSTFEEDDALYQVITNDSVSKIGYFGPENEYIYIYTYGDVRGVSEELKLDYLIDCTYDSRGQRLYATGSIGILDVNLGRLELAFTLNGGHTDIVRSTLWHMASGMLVSSSEDGSVCVWRQQLQ
eukprot:jgi/Hompol1/7093/HPOL_000739-RA